MLQVQDIRNDFDGINTRLAKRGKSFENELNQVIALDDKRKQTQTSLDNLLANLNTVSKQIGECFKSGNREEAEKLKAQTVEIKDQSKALEVDLKQAITDLTDVLTQIPNVPSTLVRNCVYAWRNA
jgi:seryl-tRNA synthetase